MGQAPKVLALLAALAALVACGGEGSPAAATDPGQIASVPSAPKARLTVTYGLDTISGPSLDPGYSEYVRFTTVVTESAGVGAHLNYVRGEFYRSGVLVERYEMSASELVAAGGNRIDPMSTTHVPVTLRRNGPSDLVRTTFQFTDDRGNDVYIAGNLGAGTTLSAASAGTPDTPRP